MESFKLFIEAEDAALTALVKSLEQQYPVKLFVSRGINSIHIHEIRVADDQRGQGVGSAVIRAIQKYAQEVDMPIVLSPQPDHGKKAKLLSFYRNLGFYPNKGRKADYSLGGAFGVVWVWRPQGE